MGVRVGEFYIDSLSTWRRGLVKEAPLKYCKTQHKQSQGLTKNIHEMGREWTKAPITLLCIGSQS